MFEGLLGIQKMCIVELYVTHPVYRRTKGNLCDRGYVGIVSNAGLDAG